jgi:hypothetical protein
MYKIIKASKDTYIQNKWINRSRKTSSNVGQAASIDLFHLYNESNTSAFLTGSALSQSLHESSRGLIYFDFSSLSSSVGSSYTDPSFKAFLSLKNIYGGTTTPSNFTVSINPLAKEFNEGIGFDVVEYRDLDTANWLTSSRDFSGGSTLWSVSGANASGSIGTLNVDFYTDFQVNTNFVNGLEDLYVNITPFVSAVLSNQIVNNGLRIALTTSIDNGNETYFVKRFGSRHINKEILQPKVVCILDDSFFQNNEDLYFNFNNKIGVKNKKFGNLENFISNSIELTGSNCLKFEMIASKSISFQTNSFSPSHSMSISHNTRSILYYSQSFSGSQLTVNNLSQKGKYIADVNLDYNSSDFVNFHSNSLSEVYFKGYWKSLDGTVTFGHEEKLKFKKDSTYVGGNINESNVLSLVNFKHEYKKPFIIKFTCLLTNNNSNLDKFSRLPKFETLLSDNFFYRVIDAYTRDEIIPFTTESNATKLSCDGNCMTFSLETENFITNKVYELEFMQHVNDSETIFYKNMGYRFKVI